jgi:LPXTG-motif cell wall-anchored protein
MLIRAGLPKTAPATAASRAASHTGKKMRIALGAGAGIVLAAGALVLLRRRR